MNAKSDCHLNGVETTTTDIGAFSYTIRVTFDWENNKVEMHFLVIQTQHTSMFLY